MCFAEPSLWRLLEQGDESSFFRILINLKHRRCPEGFQGVVSPLCITALCGSSSAVSQLPLLTQLTRKSAKLFLVSLPIDTHQ
jgi:hypothetical protein